MLIIYATLFTTAMRTALAAEDQPLPSSFVKSKQGIIDTGHDGQRDYVYRQPKPQSSRSIQNNNAKLSYYKDKPGPRTYEGGFKSPAPYATSLITDQSAPYFGNLFTMSAGYKVGNEGPPVKQVTRNQNAGVHGPGSPNLQLPTYRIGYSLPKASGPQLFSPAMQNQFNKKASSILQAQNYPTYFNHYQSQPLILSPADQFTYPERTPKLNNAQLSAPFLSPYSSFQGQVIPISITNSNPQFPQYKGAAVQVRPTVGGLSAIGYEPLQTQPQLHFGKGNVHAAGAYRNLGPVQQIRTDVEVIDKKKPTTPPPNDDDDGEGVDDSGKDYGPGNNGDDDYEPKPDKSFKPSQMEGNFKPSNYFPFKQYDEKFGKYSKQNHEEEADEKPYTKYSDYSSSSDDDNDDDEDDNSSGKYRSGKQENEDDGNSYDYDREKAEHDGYRSKYFEKNIDDDFGGSYGSESPKQKYVKEESEDDYVPKSSYRNTDHYDSDDSTGQGSRHSFTYYKNPRGHRDNVGQGSDILTQVAYDGGFGYKLPKNVRSFKNRMVN
ncbi:uncharacterized protein LOC143210352 [Lasioglossum baleicum]|uniref:uncharacterized protein LOC143210352 n=1 Tax=Lasioglossum baleicum TaxID=434251 RepID=UPI003FCCFA26